MGEVVRLFLEVGRTKDVWDYNLSKIICFKMLLKRSLFFIILSASVLRGVSQNIDSTYLCDVSNFTSDEQYEPYKTTALSVSKRETLRRIQQDTNIKVLLIDILKFRFKKNSFLPSNVECLCIPYGSIKICEADTNKIKLRNLKYFSFKSDYCKAIPDFVLTSQNLKGITINLKNEQSIQNKINRFTFQYLHIGIDHFILDSLPNFIYLQKELVSLSFDLNSKNEKCIKLSNSILNLDHLQRLSLPIVLDDSALKILSKLNLLHLTVNCVDIKSFKMISTSLPHLQKLTIKKPMSIEARALLRTILPNAEVKVIIR